MYVLTKEEEFLCNQITDCAYRVHKQLGPGLLEKIYETCFCYELQKKEIPFRRQVRLPIKYYDLEFDEGLILDVLVNELIICEFKAVDNVHPIWQAQILSHLRLSDLNIGFIINFNNRLIREGIRRYCVEPI